MEALVIVLALLHAPVPLVKPAAKPMSPVGEWNLRWRGCEGPVRFDKDGSFHCVWQGKYWVGTWQMNAEGDRLHVEERIHGTPDTATPFKWSAYLKPGAGWQGVVECAAFCMGDNGFKLEKHK